MRALLGDSRMGRLLHPPCHMLGVTPPPEIATPPPRTGTNASRKIW